MPVIVRLQYSTILMYFDDHNPPHFHIKGNDGREAEVLIADLTVRKGAVERKALKEALEWAQNAQEELWEKWNAFSGS